MKRVFVALGANLGEPAAQLDAACQALAALPDSRLIAVSRYYRSTAVGYENQPDFTNAVAELASTLPPLQLLDALLAIEAEAGRVRTFQNAPRPLDLDLLLYGEQQIAHPRLTVPHPRMLQRAFVLLPLAEIAPTLSIAGAGPLAALLSAVDAASLTPL